MTLTEFLPPIGGITALIGGGGKSTLLERLGRAYRVYGRVILCTTTKFYPPQGIKTLLVSDEAEIAAALADEGLLCLATRSVEGKFGPPALPVSRLTELADFVIVEADGAKRLPLKAHAPHEPVIPERTARTVCVLGADGFGRPISEVCHRPERYAALCGACPEDLVTPERAAAVLRAERYGDVFLVNKAESPERMAAARKLAKLLDAPVWAGSLWNDGFLRLQGEEAR